MQSTKPNRDWLKAQLRKMSALRGVPSDSLAVGAVLDQWERILSQVGEYRFAKAISSCVANRDFFPSIPEFEGHIPPEGSGRQECPRCSRTEGWLTEERPHPWKDGQTHMVASRCKHC